MLVVKIVGFTGTQHGMSELQLAAFSRELSYPQVIDEFHHGDCIGADAEAAEIADNLRYYIVCHPPDIPRKRAYYKHRRGDYMSPLPYMVRNEAIVAVATEMMAAPSGLERDNPRSGTWATIRRARARGIPVKVIWPDGRVE